MISLKNIHALSAFLRNTKSFIARLKKSGQPEVLTINGNAEIVVLSAVAYQDLMEQLETAKTLNSVHQGALTMLQNGDITAEKLVAGMHLEASAAPMAAPEAFAEIERRIHRRRNRKASHH